MVKRFLIGLICASGLASCGWAQAKPAPALEPIIQLIQDGKLDEAETQLRSLLQRHGRAAALLHNLGLVEQKRGAHAKAILQFRQALLAQSDFAPSHLALGVSLLALNKTAEAVAALERAVKRLPQEPQARVQLARAYERQANWLGVVTQYQALREQFPREPQYAYALGRAYTRVSEWSYERLIAVSPDGARLHQALGQQYVAQGKYELALAEYQRAAQVDPRLPEIHLGIAIIHFEQQRWAEAAREIELELKLAPESEKARALKAQIEKAKP